MIIPGEGEITFRRYENRRAMAYRMERSGDQLTARSSAPEPPAVQARIPPAGPPAGILAMWLKAGAEPSKLEVAIRNQAGQSLAADFPRDRFQQLVLGPHVDPRRGNAVPGVWPPSPQLGAVDRVLLLQDPNRTLPPWEKPSVPLPGEEDPLTVAGAMVRWSAANRNSGLNFPAVAVGTSGDAASKWVSAPAPGERPVLLAPAVAFPGLARSYAGAIREAWKAGPVMDTLPTGLGGGLVLVVSAEPGGLLAGRLRALSRDPEMGLAQGGR
jgi:hypothetical protein